MRVNSERGCMTCAYCASDWVPDPNLDDVAVLEPSGVACPICWKELKQGRLSSRGVLYCESCRGLLIRLAEFVPIIEEMRASRTAPAYTGQPPSPQEQVRQVICPLCGKPMENHQYGGPGNILMDTCEPCEVHWLDKGELKRIALAPDHRYARDEMDLLGPPSVW